MISIDIALNPNPSSVKNVYVEIPLQINRMVLFIHLLNPIDSDLIDGLLSRHLYLYLA